MNTIEASGKNVEEALKSGLKELGCDISEVTYEVIDAGSPGIFGMFGRLARVRISRKEEENEFDFNMPTLSLEPEKAPQPSKADKPRNEKPKAEKVKTEKAEKAEKFERPARAEKPVKTEKSAQSEEKHEAADKKAETAEAAAEPEENAPAKPHRRRSRGKKAQDGAAREETPLIEASPKTEEPVREFPPLDIESLSEDGKKAYEFLKNVTMGMGVEVDIRLIEEEEHILVDITGDTLGVLIGHRGETMDALQYLTSLTVNKGRNDYTRISIDVEHYRAKREETLRKLAVRMANRVCKTGRRQGLEPMNPYERRVLHSALQDNPYVQTHSEGEEPYRRVIITPK